jgi:excisionase family DNA binding protein
MTPKTRSIRTISPSIVARWLNVETETVLRWIHRKELPALNIGTQGKLPRFRIFRKDLVTFMHQRGLPVDSIHDLVKF